MKISMATKMTKFPDDSQNVIKYVFETDEVCYEAVLYKYPTYAKRTVLCISTQCGCPVGCVFCGTGKKFIRNLTLTEIVDQVFMTLDDAGIIDVHSEEAFYYDNGIKYLCQPERLQIMFMSMGEPFLNYSETMGAIEMLNNLFPNAELLLSTIGPKKEVEFSDFLSQCSWRTKIGLQFSIHRAYDDLRNELIPFKNKMSLMEIRNYGVEWYAKTGRKVYLNYCIDDSGMCARPADYKKLMLLFPPNAFAFTFSVVCSADETMKDAGCRNLDTIRHFEQHFIDAGYNTRIFDPAGQDTIGGGCGQLWYVQQWMKKNR